MKRDVGLPHHLWLGEIYSEEKIDPHLGSLLDAMRPGLSGQLPTELLLLVLERLGRECSPGSPSFSEWEESLARTGVLIPQEISDGLSGIGAFLRRESMESKLRREFGSIRPLDPIRMDPRSATFESWSPLGFIVHVAPANAFSVGVLSVIEGLLAGNVNFLKLSRGDGDFPLLFLRRLTELDTTGVLKNYVFAARIASDEIARLRAVFMLADGVAAWGGEDGIEGVRKHSPAHARFIDWGPKISFSYVSKEKLSDSDSLRAIARECCVIEQQACSSPQVVYLEISPGESERLEGFGRQFHALMEEESKKIPRILPRDMEQAEITTVLEMARLEGHLGLTKVFSTEAARVIVEKKSGLRASPLFRTVWIKPLLRAEIFSVLRPLRNYLQTCGLVCTFSEYSELSSLFTRAGVLRLTPPGKMLESYMGEPHDGVYALTRYAKRISFQMGELAGSVSRLGELAELPTRLESEKEPILTKEGFQALKGDAELYFKSGGSSGKPKVSVFTYEDYHEQMGYGAEGLRAAGLDPTKDRCMNLFFGGGLYGGFLSFFSILEDLEAVHFPMGAHSDFRFVADTIIEHKVDTLLGMPSYLIQLFQTESESLKEYGGIKKIFYGGEHFNELQRIHLQENFGVSVIRSASYGSVDAGPLGFQCEYCTGSVHHLHSDLHEMEIIDFVKDAPVPAGEPGRLLVTVKRRKGQKIRRYEIGDTVRAVSGSCPCGRKQPRFELLGRHGDIFRVGTTFLNYGKILKILEERFAYAAELQVYIPTAIGGAIEQIELRLSEVEVCSSDLGRVRSVLLGAYPDLREAVEEDHVLELKLVSTPLAGFSRTAGSGKLIRIVDARKR